MQMGERLAQRECHLMPVEGSPKQYRQQIHSTLGASAGCNNLRATGPVMCREIVDSRVQAEKREVVRRQDERLGRNCAAQCVERVQKARQWIAVGLVSLDADIGRYLGQDLVTRDQYAGLCTVEAGELRRMAFADDHSPFPPADLYDQPVGKPLESSKALKGHRGDSPGDVRQKARSPLRRALPVGQSRGAVRRNRPRSRVIRRANSHSFSLAHNGACQRSASQPASPI